MCTYYSERTVAKNKHKLKKKYTLFVISVSNLLILENLNLFTIVHSTSLRLLYTIQDLVFYSNLKKIRKI